MMLLLALLASTHAVLLVLVILSASAAIWVIFVLLFFELKNYYIDGPLFGFEKLLAGMVSS